MGYLQFWETTKWWIIGGYDYGVVDVGFTQPPAICGWPAMFMGKFYRWFQSLWAILERCNHQPVDFVVFSPHLSPCKNVPTGGWSQGCMVFWSPRKTLRRYKFFEKESQASQRVRRFGCKPYPVIGSILATLMTNRDHGLIHQLGILFLTNSQNQFAT